MKNRFNISIININGSGECKIKYNNSIRWKNYARRIEKNPYIKKTLLNRYNNTCQFCGQPLNCHYVIHHLDYDRCCISEDIIEISHPTEKRPNKTVKVPDCEHCTESENCLNRLRPVCGRCNLIIENIYQKQHQKQEID